MLGITRNPGEKLFLIFPDGTEIVLTYSMSGRKKNQIRLGIEAPKDVRVVRGEIKT